MNQQKTGELLKGLRKEKGLTQEQLAERFCVSSRTVSRWETGSNLPDVSTLIELADFYDVDIREIIDGERKSEIMDKETKDTLKKVAAYATEGEKRKQSRVVHVALVVCLVLIVCTLLFFPRPGFLYGILDEGLCQELVFVLYLLALMLLIFYVRVWCFQEKPTNEPERSVRATVKSRKIVSGTGRSGRSQMGMSFVITFQTEEGESLELYAYEEEYGALREGMAGTLTYRGRYFVSFENS